MADPLEAARALLVLARLLHASRMRSAKFGVIPARAAAAKLVPIGKRLAVAVEEAERASSDSVRQAALEDVARIGEELAGAIDNGLDGVAALVTVALEGVTGERARKPGV
jgi:hypothetical protein